MRLQPGSGVELSSLQEEKDRRNKSSHLEELVICQKGNRDGVIKKKAEGIEKAEVLKKNKKGRSFLRKLWSRGFLQLGGADLEVQRGNIYKQMR